MKQRIAFALIMAKITTGIISFTLISVNIGYIPAFLKIWLTSWSIAYAVAIPVILFVGPLVQRLVGRMFAQQN